MLYLSLHASLSQRHHPIAVSNVLTFVLPQPLHSPLLCADHPAASYTCAAVEHPLLVTGDDMKGERDPPHHGATSDVGTAVRPISPCTEWEIWRREGAVVAGRQKIKGSGDSERTPPLVQSSAAPWIVRGRQQWHREEGRGRWRRWWWEKEGEREMKRLTCGPMLIDGLKPPEIYQNQTGSKIERYW